MSSPADHPQNPSSDEHRSRSGRYRYCGGKAIDPNEGVHPEMVEAEQPQPIASEIPNSPQELIAMQQNKPERPEKPERQQSAKVKEVLDLIEKLDTDAAEDQQIALTIVRHLESFHDDVVKEMQDDTDAKHSQIVAWSIDADRLMRSRLLLESIDLD
ncbi:hypothetical protein [Synechococcus sp. CBW1006]|uniref:hypothetical protein n=1 Tax=Synechococcus sp. CBW1006 TaxID=1353138 RepID=UPI0018CF6532|nr:hypothetical protein [Synechococcus sp. CBW1006]QPN66548.1 hypothetical protein H8F26_17795 [Synechococcus sp. CBW1006]